MTLKKLIKKEKERVRDNIKGEGLALASKALGFMIKNFIWRMAEWFKW
jgi:hypothetical protein